MDLSLIPTGVLWAEVEAVDVIKSAEGFNTTCTPLCKHVEWCRSGHCPLHEGECQALRDDYSGWSERKVQYLQHLRAEIERRA